MKAVCETLGVARSNIAERSKGRGSGRRGRPPEADGELLIFELNHPITDINHTTVHAVGGVGQSLASAHARPMVRMKRPNRAF